MMEAKTILLTLLISGKIKLNIVLYKEKKCFYLATVWQMKSEKKADYYAFCDQDDVWDKERKELKSVVYNYMHN